MDGRAIGRLLICLQERGGQFGPRVIEQVRKQARDYGNIEVICSTSGKMTTESMKQWIFDVVLPETARIAPIEEEIQGAPGPGLQLPPTAWRRVLLTGDAWAGNTNGDVVDEMRRAGVELLRIPPGTTADLQPLDVDFFRQYKVFVKRI